MHPLLPMQKTMEKCFIRDGWKTENVKDVLNDDLVELAFLFMIEYDFNDINNCALRISNDQFNDMLDLLEKGLIIPRQVPLLTAYMLIEKNHASDKK